MITKEKPCLPNLRRAVALLLALTVTLGPTVVPAFAASSKPETIRKSATTATPIQYLVVIFQENVSFDHYFGTYPVAKNPNGEDRFTALPTTPTVNGLTSTLLTNNPNLNPANGTGAAIPFRLDVSQAATADQDHDYTPEQAAFDMGAMDLFPLNTGTAGPPPAGLTNSSLVMGYFDGNTVTAYWNYAQLFAMSDNSYGTTFGPSSVGVMNLVSGQTNGIINTNGLSGSGYETSGGSDGSLTVIGDPDPLNDVCSSSTRYQVQMGNTTIGDLLNTAGVTWGAFMGGFDLTVVNPNGTTGCARSTKSNITGVTESDYIPHHSFFQYWANWANPNHTLPANIAEVGNNGQANHQYDINEFFAAVLNGTQPTVSFLKAPGYQDGHAGYSDPTDEQTFIVNTINFLQNPANNPNWDSTAVVIAYDDSDGWYDHQMSPIVNTSSGTADVLTGPGLCGNSATALPGYLGAAVNPNALGRCGYGPRLPLLVISPWARQNFVDHSVTDQSSIIHFIEDNWLGSTRIGNGSFDGIANSISQMFEFTLKAPRANGTLCLSPLTGERQRPTLCGLP
jgi:phospholipase C